MSEPAPSLLHTKSATTIDNVVSLDGTPGHEILDRKSFTRMLYLERKRTERSRRRFVLVLLESGSLLKSDNDHQALAKVVSVLSHSTRETDIKGWYEEGRILGVIFTEIGPAEGKAVAKAILGRITSALCESLGIDDINEIRMSFHVFPEDSNRQGPSGLADLALYPELKDSKRGSRAVKRSMDIAGSLCALILSSPLLLVISIMIKLSSKGPVLFRQERIGQYGKRFGFLKFRSMYVNNDPAIHEEYVRRLIEGTAEGPQLPGATHKVYKLTNDPRVTPLGRFLRNRSLDELPQFLNVLMGSMSMVGPRPPVPYEFDSYDIWHKRRLLAVKPGITGPWQVGGRSKVKFDDMVRMDLEYAKSWSPWLDLKILLRTPRAVLSGDGAF